MQINNIIYLSNVCTQKKFDKLSEEGLIKNLPQAQRYNLLMINGLKEVTDKKISVISSYPIVGRAFHYFKTEYEENEKVMYYYLSFLQIPFFRQICLRYNAFKNKKKIDRKHDSVIICDVLNKSIAGAARKYSKKYGTLVCGIVTDVPGLVSNADQKKKSIWQRAFGKFCSFVDGKSVTKYPCYLLLTKQMNDVVNIHNKPYIVLEGQCDLNMKDIQNNIDNKDYPKVIMYAGGLHKEYGIDKLIDAFKEAALQNWILKIYGLGNYVDEIVEEGKLNHNIEYCGCVSNSEIINKQLKASLLVNPRPTDAEYVKYSFPSKTIEYMASGTPLLTTNLPGMPDEYKEFVYLFDSENNHDMASKLSEICGLPNEELHNFGLKSKEFILKEKNNVLQAKKLWDFIEQVQNDIESI